MCTMEKAVWVFTVKNVSTMCSNNNMNFIFLYTVARILPFFVYVNKATCDKLPETLIRYFKKLIWSNNMFYHALRLRYSYNTLPFLSHNHLQQCGRSYTELTSMVTIWLSLVSLSLTICCYPSVHSLFQLSLPEPSVQVHRHRLPV